MQIKPKEFQYFWRIPLASQLASQPATASPPAAASQAAGHSRPASHSQPASHCSNRHWITFNTKLLPEVQNLPLLLMYFFNHSIVEYRWPASQPIQYFVGRVTTSVYQNVLE